MSPQSSPRAISTSSAREVAVPAQAPRLSEQQVPMPPQTVVLVLGAGDGHNPQIQLPSIYAIELG